MADVEVVTIAVDHDGSAPDVEVRPVEGRPGYYIGRDGVGWRMVKDGRLVRLRILQRRDGCAMISVVRGRKKIGAIYVARAVLTAFVGPPPNGYVARHWPDPDQANNRVENLRWGTQGSYSSWVAKIEAEPEAESCVAVAPISPPSPRFIGPLAGLLEDDRKRRRRLMKSQLTVATYREVQAKAGHRIGGQSGWRPSPWD